MAASQARLLSITARITNNEMQAQFISDSKVRLASESDKVANDYIEALHSDRIMYATYNDNGEQTRTDFTAATIYNYAPLKNQYMLVNTSNKVLTTHQDAVNFKQTDDLVGFLKCYNLVYDASEDIYKAKMEQWEKECARLRAEYTKRMADYDKLFKEYEAKHLEWEQNPYYSTTNNSLYEMFISMVGTSNTATGAGVEFCYYNGLNGDPGCYLHLLNHLLGYDGNLHANTYYTSLEQECNTNGTMGGMDSGITQQQKNTFKELSDAIADETYVCDGADDFTPYYNNDGVNDKLEGNIIQAAIDEGRVPTDVEILMSDYIYNPETTSNAPYGSVAGIKSLKQKAIDLYYLIQNGLVGDRETMRSLLINFTEGDLKMTSKAEKPEPQPPTKPELVLPDPPEKSNGYILVKDKDKSQWYTNLWYKMNNSIAANAVKDVDFENDLKWKDIPESVQREYQFEVPNNYKDEENIYYEELEDTLSTSEEWLQFALEHGICTLEQAIFTQPTNDVDKVPEYTDDGYTWKYIPYTNAMDIVIADDEVKQMRAEVEYKRRTQEIQAKDKKYDQDLRKLDTEHNALQTEYESIKELINKNVDRSFKAFS